MLVRYCYTINPHFSPPFYCDGAMPHPACISLGQSAQHSVNYAYTDVGKGREPGSGSFACALLTHTIHGVRGGAPPSLCCGVQNDRPYRFVGRETQAGHDLSPSRYERW